MFLCSGPQMEAVELYRKATRHPEAAALLAKIAQASARRAA